MTHAERVAFWMNLYHALMLHIRLLRADDDALRDEHFHVFKYRVGHEVVSLYDIEHCILRAKTTLPQLVSRRRQRRIEQRNGEKSAPRHALSDDEDARRDNLDVDDDDEDDDDDDEDIDGTTRNSHDENDDNERYSITDSSRTLVNRLL